MGKTTVETVSVFLDVALPSGVNATQKQILEWVKFNVHYRNSMDSKNPLAGYDLVATWVNLYR
jgi:hypothetical protein